MKLIESKAEYIPQEEGLEGIYKAIELAGRTAYHSSTKYRYWTYDRKNFINEGTEDFKLLYNPEEYPIKQNISAKDFVDRMINSKHGAALEAGTVYLEKPAGFYENDNVKYELNPHSKSKCVSYTGMGEKVYFEGEKYIISTNYRVLVENNWLDDLQYLCSPTEFHEKRYTMRFTCSRAIAQELTRHRVFSFLMESQRYINYSKERHGGEITFIKPSWLNVPTGIVYWHDGICWRVQQDENNPTEWFSIIPKDGFSEEEAQVASTYFNALSHAEKKYFSLLREKCQPQQARDVLPNATKTELIMTGFASDWKFLMDLRLFEKTGKVHPDMKDLMQKAQKAMQEAGIWEDIMSKPSKFE